MWECLLYADIRYDMIGKLETFDAGPDFPDDVGSLVNFRLFKEYAH